MSSSSIHSDSQSKNPTSLYSRKEKSLGVLCSNFLRLYDRDDVDCIGLDHAADQLGVERRRIYDIVNILESVGLLSRRAKNQYTWKGFAAIPRTLDALKEEGLREKLSGQNIANVLRENEYRQPSNLSTKQDNTHELIKGDNRKEKSLALLTQNFIKLFLCSDVEFISLDNAASALLGNMHDPTAMRTKVRRLYDIANVFASMNLIEKIRHPESGKPAFRWIGQVGNPGNGSRSAANVTDLKRTFGADITNTVPKRCKAGSSSDWKPSEHATQYAKHGNLKDENSKVSPDRHKHGSKDFEFGPFSPSSVPREVLGNINVGQIPNWENLASTYRPRYCNKALSDLFGHYVEAWNSWYVAADADEKQHDQHLP
ncbi:E2F transcription factor-like E2FF isoform X1 [Ipomoea triloba]|uniref:E2F transcription factor-like E2FF isoform X1 n=1 Tax=Ipomoea triloba TaxID=35885 RepID=UPI00125DBC8D|nr:E2F transcription factor-like E2FF isoform X1 [Ipomoea triloba]